MITKETATLIAAAIAAFASIVTLIINILSKRGEELRRQHRKILETLVVELGQVFHELIASSNMMVKSKSDKSFDRWKESAKETQETLKRLRPLVRYPLWGIDEGLRTLSRFPDWIQHARNNPKRVDELFILVTKLTRKLDVIVLNSYTKGRPPTYLDQFQINRSSRKLRKYFDASKDLI